MQKITSHIFKINTSDPNDAAGGKLLNILLVGVAVLTTLMLITTGFIQKH